MQYTQAQIDQYWTDYVQSNEESIKERLRFLLDNYKPENEDYLSPPDVHYCFEEARHAFMVGDFVASIIMCAVTIERQLARLLGLPYHNPVDEKISLEGVGEKIIKTAKEKEIIDEELKDKLLELNTLRNDFVHGIDSSVHKRPQKQDSIKNAFMWTEPNVLQNEIEENAKKAIKILFEAREKLHYSKLKYYQVARQFSTGTKFGSEKGKVQNPARIPPQTPPAGGKKAEAIPYDFTKSENWRR